MHHLSNLPPGVNVFDEHINPSPERDHQKGCLSLSDGGQCSCGLSEDEEFDEGDLRDDDFDDDFVEEDDDLDEDADYEPGDYDYED